MPVQSIECQLVRAQIGRYLGGEPLSQEAMRQLEVHLVGCDECRAAIAVRKSDIRAKMATEAKDGRYPKKNDIPAATKAAIDYKSVQAAAEAAAEPPKKPAKPKKAGTAWKSPSFTKPMVLTLLLGGVLVMMSRMSGGNGFGVGASALNLFAGASTPAPKAATTQPASTPTTSTTATQPGSTPSTSSTSTTQPVTTPTTSTTAGTPPVSTPANQTTSGSQPVTTPPTAANQPVAQPPTTPPAASTSSPATTAPTSGQTASSGGSTPANTKPAAASGTSPSTTTATPAVTHPTPSEATKPKPATHSVPEPAKTVSHKEEPAPVHHARKAHRSVHRRKLTVHHRRPVRHAATRIRVYDASGDPIQN